MFIRVQLGFLFGKSIDKRIEHWEYLTENTGNVSYKILMYVRVSLKSSKPLPERRSIAEHLL